MTQEKLGTPSEAADKLGVDMAEVFNMYAAGLLTMTRDDDGALTVWMDK